MRKAEWNEKENRKKSERTIKRTIKKNKRKIFIKVSGLFRKKRSSVPEENEETIPNPNQLTAENDIRKDLTT